MSGTVIFDVPNTIHRVSSGIITPPFGSVANTIPLEMLGTKYFNHADSSPILYSPIAGSMANVVLYNRALTAEEIFEIYVSTRSRFV